MSVVLIAILVLVVALVAASVALGRATYEVSSASDTEYVEVEGNWVRYRVVGGGPAVVLVHGWLSSGRVWDELAGQLAQRFTVYSLDLSGFGESDKPLTGYGVRYGSRQLYAFCAHFGLTRAAIVGHDVGGAMAVKLAADHPEVVDKLVLVGTPATEDQIDLPTGLWLATLPVVGPIFYALGRYLRPVRKLWLRPFVSYKEDLTDEMVDDAGRSTAAATAKTLTVMQREISRSRLVRQAAIVKVPVLAVAGEEDQIVDPQALTSWERAFPNTEIVYIEGVGHLPMLESAREFNAQILAFLTGDARYVEELQETELEEESLPSGPGEPDEAEDSPAVRRKQAGSYPPSSEADAEAELEARHDEENAGLDREGSSKQDLDERVSGDEGGEWRHGVRRTDRRAAEDAADEEGEPTRSDAEDLFQWPDTRDEFQPRRPFKPSRDPEEPDDEPVGEDLVEKPHERREEEGPEEGPRR